MPRRLRWLPRIAATLLAVLVIAIATMWLALRGSLPRQDGEFALAGLSQPATILRDVDGIATITAANRGDLSRALGYLHAQERYFEMDLARRSAAGELAGLFGAIALPIDRRHRVHRFRKRVEGWWKTLPADDREQLAAYAQGVNAGLADLDVRPWPYLLLRTSPRSWRGEDSLLVVLAMFFDLQDEQNGRERDLDRARRVLPTTVFDFIVRGGTPWDAPIVGDPMAEPALPSPSDIDLRTLPAVPVDDEATLDRDIVGSNSFAVAGRLTPSGHAMVANDMHLGLGVPNIWFRARLVHGDGDDRVDVQGVTLPGVPAMVVGSNGRVAWAFTNSYGDWLDFVRLDVDPANPDRYRTGGGWRDFERHEERIAIGSDIPVDNSTTHRVEGSPAGNGEAHRPGDGAIDGGTREDEGSDTYETLVVRETLWGPVVGEDADGRPLALAWTAHRDGAVNTAMLALETARDVDEALAIAARSGVPAQNFLVGDAGGRIGWTIAGRMPRRAAGFDATLPVDGAALDGDLWQEWLPADAYPRVVDPASGRLWTANARVVDGQGLAMIGDGGYDNGARAAQIRDGLFARDRFDEADLLAIQLDDRALFMARWWQLLRDVIGTSPDDSSLAGLGAASATWDGCACIESVSYRMARAFRLYVHETVMRGLEAPMREHDADFRWPRLGQNEGVVWQLLGERPAHLLPPPYATWDELLTAQARRVADVLAGKPGDLARRTWGDANIVRVRHPLSQALPAFLGNRLDMPPQALPGDSHMPRVQGVRFGASQRMVVAPGRSSQAIMHMPGGQSGHPLSTYYGAGHDDWAQGQPTPMQPAEPRWRLELLPVP